MGRNNILLVEFFFLNELIIYYRVIKYLNL